MTHGELVKDRLKWEDWEELMRQALRTSREEVGRRSWRGGRGGILPRGYDVESVASEAVWIMLNGESRLVIGWTAARIRKELRRVVRRLVERLHRLKETESTRTELNGSLAKLAGPKDEVFQAVAGREEERERERLKEQFWRRLSDAPELLRLARELSKGKTSVEALASRTGMDVREVKRARRRLRRKIKKCATELLRDGSTADGRG